MLDLDTCIIVFHEASSVCLSLIVSAHKNSQTVPGSRAFLSMIDDLFVLLRVLLRHDLAS